MQHWTTLGRTSAVALLLSSTAAFADVTAAEVWADWKALFESYGMTVATASEAQDGGTLTVQGLASTMAIPEGGDVTATLDQIVFAEQGDGTVRITIAPEYRIVANAAPAGGPQQTTTITMRTDGFSMVASGDATTKAYDYTAPSVGIAVTEVVIDGQSMPGQVDFTMSNVAGRYTTTPQGEGRAISSDLSAASFAGIVDVTDPEQGNTFKFNFTVSDLAGTSSAVLPGTMAMANLDQMIKAGFDTASQMTYGPATFSFDANEAGTTSTGSGKSDGGSLEIAIGAQALVYGTTSRGLSFTISGSDIPLPEVALTIAEGAFRLSMPTQRTDAPAAFSFLSSTRGLTISEGIWNMFDPGAQLPRDPATLVIDLAGQARWLVDIMNPEAAGTMAGPPAELTALNVNALEVQVAGAGLTGTGAFTFDNSDMTTFPGMPKPTGSADLQLVGGNALLDKLVAMGLFPEDQAMGFRMMLGLFARPGDGADTLVSKIEVTADGQVLANGQRIR